MIRDTRRINIETNFFDDDIELELKGQQDTFDSTLHTKEKGAIALYNIMDTIRLHRIINSFNCITSIPPVRIRKYSSKVMLLKDLGQQKKSLIVQSGEENKQFRENTNQEDSQPLSARLKYQPKFLNKKRSQSATAPLARESQYLRQSRKRILQGISKQLEQQPQSRSRSHQKQRSKPSSKPKPDLRIKIPVDLKEQTKLADQNRQTVQIKRRLQKLQHLMKNIRRQKQKQQPVRIHQKKQVSHIPKRQKNHQQMRIFLQQISSLRREVSQVKQLNQTILRQSRQRSHRSSSAAKSQNPIRANAVKQRFLGSQNIKRSQVLEDKKYIKTVANNKSEKSYNQKLNELHNKHKKQIEQQYEQQQQSYTPRQRILNHTKVSKDDNMKIRTRNSDNKYEKKANKSQILQKSQPQFIPKQKQGTQMNKQKYKQKYKIETRQARGSNRQRLKREPSITQSQDQLNNNNQIILTNQSIQKGPQIKQQAFKKTKQVKIVQNKQQNSSNVQKNAKEQYIQVYDKSRVPVQVQSKKIEYMGNINKDAGNIRGKELSGNKMDRSNQKEYKQTAWYRQYGQPRYNIIQQQIKPQVVQPSMAVRAQIPKIDPKYTNIYDTTSYNYTSIYSSSNQNRTSNVNSSSNNDNTLQNLYSLGKLNINDAVSDFQSRNTSSMNSPNNTNNNNAYNMQSLQEEVLLNNLNNAYKSYNEYDNGSREHVQYHGYASAYSPNYVTTSGTKDYSSGQPSNKYNTYDAGTNKYNLGNQYNSSDYGKYSNSSRGSNSKSRRQQDGYTNPQLLASLNLGTYPKHNPTTTTTNSYRYQPDNLSYKYQARSNSNDYNINISTIGKQLQPGKDSKQRYSNNSNPSKDDKLISNNVLSDNSSSYNSYTYSKGSSAVTSMNKLEQEYNNIINNDDTDTRERSNRNTANSNAGNDNYAHYQPRSYQSAQDMAEYSLPGYSNYYPNAGKHNGETRNSGEGYHYEYKTNPHLAPNNSTYHQMFNNYASHS